MPDSSLNYPSKCRPAPACLFTGLLSLTRGIAPISGPYDLRHFEELANYVPTEQAKADASPLLHIKDPVPYAIVAHGTNNAEEDGFAPSSRALVEALRQHGTRVNALILTDKGHIGTAMALGTPGSRLSNAVLEMISASTPPKANH